MVELEARFEVQGRPVLLVGWYEGSGSGRIVVTGPNNLREDVQVSLEVSLFNEINQAMEEAPPKGRSAALRVHYTLVTDGSRQTRSVDLAKGGTTSLDQLSSKLLGMAELMVQGEQLKKIVSTLKANC